MKLDEPTMARAARMVLNLYRIIIPSSDETQRLRELMNVTGRRLSSIGGADAAAGLFEDEARAIRDRIDRAGQPEETDGAPRRTPFRRNF